MSRSMKLSPLQQHKADLEQIIYVCRQMPVAEELSAGYQLFGDRIARLAEALLMRLPEKSYCPNHDATQICPDCTS